MERRNKMTNPVNVSLETKVQAVNDNGDAEPTATVSYIVSLMVSSL